MKFLVSIPRTQVTDEKTWTTRREPVVPCFPSQHSGAFLAVPSFMLADRAEVAEIPEDADALAAALAKEYPGLPRVLHENYVLAVWKAVYELPPGTVFTVRVNQQQAMLVDVKTGKTIILWNSQPMTASAVL